MRDKRQLWLLPIVVLFVVIWATGKKSPSEVEQPISPTPVSTLAAVSPGVGQKPSSSTLEHFVNADKLNLRASPGGTVVGSLKRGDTVRVYERHADWGRISLDGQAPRWLSFKNLCTTANCFANATQKRQRAVPQPARNAGPTYGMSCPCSSGRVCIGPRGGRYCITSGGNKRYGI
ncbi:SH3 domain-containing protein [Pseudomonas sp. S36]|uniref:SH3 domain-containing protein n=1 Tax=Pseudomonas sp. S36 TaxID=2767447 RepID=UPI001911C47A|nr:SH3 domain-containing protein [Pseudomonas sp. S36]